MWHARQSKSFIIAKSFFFFYSAQVEKHKTSTRVLKTHRRKASFVKRGEAETS